MCNSKIDAIDIWRKYINNKPYKTIILTKLNNYSGKINPKNNLDKYQFIVESSFLTKNISISSILFGDNLSKLTISGINENCYESLINYFHKNKGITIMDIILILGYYEHIPNGYKIVNNLENDEISYFVN